LRRSAGMCTMTERGIMDVSTYHREKEGGRMLADEWQFASGLTTVCWGVRLEMPRGCGMGRCELMPEYEGGESRLV
jgi:hypothetical protein